MADPVRTSQTNSSTFQRMLDKKDAFYSFVGKTYDETIMLVGKNPKKAFWVGATATAMAFGVGFKVGNHASSDSVVMGASRTIALVQNQNVIISNTLDGMAKNYTDLTKAIGESNKQTDIRLANLENKFQWKQAADEGARRLQPVEKKKRSKWLPWNWFK